MSGSNFPVSDVFVAICQVKARYCRTLDTRDWDAFTELFTEDLVMEPQGVDAIKGRDEAMAFVREALATAKTAHHVHIPEIEMDGDAAANVIWAMQDRNTWDPPRNGVSTQCGYGHYYERYVLDKGEWKIARQKLVYLHLDINKN